MKPKWNTLLGLIVILTISPSCSTARQTHERLHGTLWIQTSAEYRIAAQQSFNLAKEMLGIALSDPTWTAAQEQEDSFSNLPTAVILDIDETVLDNSRFEGKLIATDSGFNRETWERWIRKSESSPVPGSLDFVTFAQSKGVKVFYVTNRNYRNEDYTRNNLKTLGFPVMMSSDSILSKNEKEDWGSDKSTRRKFVTQGHRVLLLIGDDLNDFVSGAESTPEQRLTLAEKYKTHWGRKWILVPNPLYGSWEATLYGFAFDLSDREKLERKYRKLEVFE